MYISHNDVLLPLENMFSWQILRMTTTYKKCTGVWHSSGLFMISSEMRQLRSECCSHLVAACLSCSADIHVYHIQKVHISARNFHGLFYHQVPFMTTIHVNNSKYTTVNVHNAVCRNRTHVTSGFPLFRTHKIPRLFSFSPFFQYFFRSLFFNWKLNVY